MVEFIDIAMATATLQRQNTEISKQIFPEKEYRGLSYNFHIHASGTLQIAQRHMNVDIGAEAALFPEKEYINGFSLQCTVDEGLYFHR
jgi:hypothetical protein